VTLGLAGDNDRGSFMMYDAETRSVWVHATGEAVSGPLNGRRLRFLPSVLTTWKSWRENHPETEVVGSPRGYRSGSLGGVDGYGVSVGQGDRVKLYPLTVLSKQRVIHDTFNERPVVVIFHPNTETVTAFRRASASQTFRWENGALVDEKDVRSNPVTGKSAKRKLTPLPATRWRIGRWKAFYPKAAVYQPPPQ